MDEAAVDSSVQSRRGRRVCVLLRHLGGGGANKMMIALSGLLAEAGCRADLVRMQAPDRLLPEVPDAVRTMRIADAAYADVNRRFPAFRQLAVIADGFRSVRLAWSLCRRLKRENQPASGVKEFFRMLRAAMRALQMARYIDAQNPDAVLAVWKGAHLTALLGRRLARRQPRLAVSMHMPGDYYAADEMRFALMSGLLPEAEAVHAVSEGLADEVAETWNLERRRVIVIYNPAFDKEILTLQKQPLNYPQLAGAGEEKIILSIGNFHEAKDHETLLRAFRLLSQKRKARLIILGEGKPRRVAELKELINSLNLSDQVLLPGFIDNPFPWLRRADAFVLSSKAEGFSIVLIEALACGCAVVSTDCPHGPREILEGGRWGRLTPVRDPRALADAMDAALDSAPDAEAQLARAEDFSADRVMPQYMEMLGLSPGRRAG